MTIVVDHGHGADKEAALSELAREGFGAAVNEHALGRTEPHQQAPRSPAR